MCVDMYVCMYVWLYFLSAIANLRAVLEAMARTNPAASQHPMASGGMMMPGVVVLISNLNEKVR